LRWDILLGGRTLKKTGWELVDNRSEITTINDYGRRPEIQGKRRYPLKFNIHKLNFIQEKEKKMLLICKHIWVRVNLNISCLIKCTLMETCLKYGAISLLQAVIGLVKKFPLSDGYF
jgi:hypothetical protein